MTRVKILETACACVCGQREQDYGRPEDNFGVIADLWRAYTGYEFTKVDVAVMMILLKAARVKTGQAELTMDSFVDIAGYAACAGEVATELEKGDTPCGRQTS